MKLHLPIRLLAIILTAISVTYTHGAVIEPIEVVEVEANTPSVAIGSDSVQQTKYSIIAKDGEGIATITGNIQKYSALHVREGELVVGNDETSTTLNIFPNAAGCGACNAGFVVAGRNALLTFNNAAYTSSHELFNIVGGADGNGKLVVDGGSKIGLYNIAYMVIGDLADAENAYSNATSDEGIRYQGEYTEAANGSGVLFGKGVVQVTGASTLNTGYQSLYMNESELTVTGSGSVVNVGGAGAENNFTIVGMEENTTAVINVKDGGKMNIRTKNFMTGYSESTTAIINIDGSGSVLTVDLTSPPHSESGFYNNITTYLGSNPNVSSKTEINITNGGTVDFKCATTHVGQGSRNEESSVDINIDKTSQLLGKDLYIYTEGNICNSGTVSANLLYLYGGDTENKGAIQAPTVYVYGGSSLFLQLGDSNLQTNYLGVFPDCSLVLNYTGNSETHAPITINANGTWNMYSGSSVVLAFAEEYIENLIASTNSVSVLVAESTASMNEASLQSNDLSPLWTSELSWEEKDGKTWITGIVNAVVNVKVDEQTELSESVADVADGTERSITVENTTATLSGNNTHTGGTTISNASVTLESATALGAGAVSTSGTSSITAADGVEAVLPGAIANKDGELTLSGTFDASALEAEVIGETYLGTDLQPGENGFFRHEGSSIQLVENDNASVSEDSTAVIKHDNGITYTLKGTDGIAVAHGETLWHTYHINTDSHAPKASQIIDASKDEAGMVRLEQVDMVAGSLDADVSVKVIASGGAITMSGQDVELNGELSGETSMDVTGTGTISGENSHTGDTTITGSAAKLTVGSEKALGESTVYLREHAALDLGDLVLDNPIHVEGCTISGASQYDGEMTVSGDLELTDATTRAAWVTLQERGNLKGNTLVTRGFELQGGSRTIETNLTIADKGAIVLHAGNALTITGNLTIGREVCITLVDGGYAEGDTLLSWSGTLTGNVADMLLDADDGFLLEQDGKTIKLALPQPPEEDKPIVGPEEDEEDKPIVGPDEDEEDKPIVGPDVPVQPDPAPVFDQATADVLAQGNWGIFTASRAFVNAVQGQRNSMGCIAGGRGTAWASLLGASHDIDGSGAAAGSDTTLFGAAVGVDMQVGKRSSLGVAFGYTDAEVKPGGLADVDQEGGYIALYGEHGLKKFANKSCLALDWVLATGTTESSYLSTDWEQDHLQANARLTWTKKVSDRFAYNVFGGVEYFASESDRVAGCKSGSIQNLRGELGIGARYVVKQGQATSCDGKGGLTPAAPGCDRIVAYGELSYINDMVRNNPSIEVGGLRGGGANPGRQGVGIEAGATFRIGERWSANANYSFNAMDDSNEHVLNIGASRTF